MRVSCVFALYPLGSETYMDSIYDAIARAKADARVTTTPEHFATRLDGELQDVLKTIRSAFDGAAAGHVTVHATISTGSPTREDKS